MNASRKAAQVAPVGRLTRITAVLYRAGLTAGILAVVLYAASGVVEADAMMTATKWTAALCVLLLVVAALLDGFRPRTSVSE